MSDRQLFLSKVRAGLYQTARILGRDPHDPVGYCRILWSEIVPDLFNPGESVAVFGVQTGGGHHAVFTDRELTEFVL